MGAPVTYTKWRTPRQLFEPLNLAVNGFAVDAAADQSNKLTPEYYGPGSPLGEDALEIDEWLNPAWCNPPYGKGLGKWLEKFNVQAGLGVSTVALLPAYVERLWWHEKVVKAGADVIFLVGRVPFTRACEACEVDGVSLACLICGGTGIDPTPSQPRDPSAIVIYGPTASGKTGWLDWRKNAKVAGDPDGDGSGPSDDQG